MHSNTKWYHVVTKVINKNLSCSLSFNLLFYFSIVTSVFAPCTCVLELCIGWYPCGLKYCKGKNENAINNNQINSSYRCGIKTCRKCSNFSYYVRQKQQCLWDEWPRKIHHNQPRKTAAGSHSVINRYFHKIFDFNLL